MISLLRDITAGVLCMHYVCSNTGYQHEDYCLTVKEVNAPDYYYFFFIEHFSFALD